MDIHAKVKVLQDADTFPNDEGPIEAIETHMSWVFLTAAHAYKLKKPVRYSFLDFSTLQARLEDCEREVLLNRRLAPEVYLGVTALRRLDGRCVVGDAGELLEWLVKMHRLPADLMLDRLIAHRQVHAVDLTSLHRVLQRFYARALRIEIVPEEYHRRFERGVRTNHAVLSDPQFDLPVELVGRLTSMQEHFLGGRRELLEARAAEGRVVNAHGDLRPQHVCMLPNPVVIDCLEFDPTLRELDPLDELGYLSLECERLGDASAGEQILGAYREANGDTGAAELIAFYKVYRACLRAKLAIWHTVDDSVADHGYWHRRAEGYLELASRYAGRMG
jgi:aminoglycoside phosphotransferase family enzyme